MIENIFFQDSEHVEMWGKAPLKIYFFYRVGENNFKWRDPPKFTNNLNLY